MFQTVCSHKMWYVNFQPKVILSLKIKSRAKTKKQNKKKPHKKKNQGILTQCSRVHKSLLVILVGLKRSFGIPKDVKEYTEILSDIEYFYL